ncbi:MAG: hypothetical protein E4H03_03910 [Myxococcales bacterium]|nr:MAG: hypothetical protein E4H03_03910 [Myxococcales bacterium]
MRRVAAAGLIALQAASACFGCSVSGAATSATPAARLAQSRTDLHEHFIDLLEQRDFQAAGELLYIPPMATESDAEHLRARARHALRLLTIEFGPLSEPEPARRGVRFYHVRFDAVGLDACPPVVGTSNVSSVTFERRGAGYVRTQMCAGTDPPRVSVVAYGLPSEREGARAETVEICAALLLAMRDARSAEEAHLRCEENIPVRI